MQFTIGIHIQPYCLHTVLVQNTQPPVVLESHTYPLSLDNNEEQRKAQFSDHLKDILKKYPPHNHHFSFTVPHKHTSVHDVQFPFKERFKIQKALPFKIEDLIPFSIEEMIYTYKISGYCKQQSHVLSFIAPQKEISEFIEWIQSLGFQSYTLTPEIAALSNLFEDWKAAPPEIESLSSPKKIKLYLSYNQSMALILCQNRVISVYNLNWGFHSCIQDIAHKYRRDMNQALDYFFENATLTHEDMSTTVPISQIVKSSFKSLAQQLHLLLIYLKGQNQSDIEEITLCGPGNSIQNLSYHLYEHIKIPVHKMEEHKDTVTSTHLIAFGTALESFKKSKNPAVNFAQSVLSTKRENQLNKKRIQIFKRVSLALLCFFAYIVVRNWQIVNINDKISGVFGHYSRSVAGLKTRNISISNVKKFLNRRKKIQTQSHLFQSLTHFPSAVDQLKKLSFSFDQLELWQIIVSQMDINGSHIHIQGAILKPYFSQLKAHLSSQAQSNTFEEKKINTKIIDQLSSAKPLMKTDEEIFEENQEDFSTAQIPHLDNLSTPSSQKELISKNKNSTQDVTTPKEWEPFNFTFKMK